MMADSMEDPIPPQLRYQLLRKQRQQNAADRGKVEVMNLKQPVQRVRRATPHNLPPSKYYNVVGYQHRCGRFQRRHRRLPRHKSEVLRLVAFDGFECFLEDGPELQAERTIERRHAILDPGRLRHVVV